MLSAILHSDTAIDASVRIIGSFVEMRHFVAGNAAMFEQIRAVEPRQLEYQKTTDVRFERVFDYMGTRGAPKQKMFFVGHRRTTPSSCQPHPLNSRTKRGK